MTTKIEFEAAQARLQHLGDMASEFGKAEVIVQTEDLLDILGMLSDLLEADRIWEDDDDED